MNARRLREAIDDPSGLIHPERTRAFATGSHPMGKNLAYPEHPPGGPTANYPEEMASRQWKKLLDKAQKYLGFIPTQNSLREMQKATVQALGIIAEAEEEHKEELEALAVELVFELKEFSRTKAVYEKGLLKIDAELGGDISMEGTLTSDEPEAQIPLHQERTPAEKEWIEKMIQRRHFTNAITHGGAISNNFLFELGGRQLDRIDPRLRKAYGTLMVATEIGYWMFPQSQIIQAARSQAQVGTTEVGYTNPDDEEVPLEDPEAPPRRVPTVKARGLMLPVLMHEIIKGLLELASLSSLPGDPEERREVRDKADLVDLESWQMILGPQIWDQLVAATDAINERDVAVHLYNAIQRMDVDKFNSFMKEILAKSPRGMQMLRELAARVKQELADDMGESVKQIVAAVLRG
jgi:hypothetical protein